MPVLAGHKAAEQIAVITEDEEDRYDELKGWDGSFDRSTFKAILLTVQDRPVWVPFSQMRKSETGDFYFSVWWKGRAGLD
jgi:hypothetical protein